MRGAHAFFVCVRRTNKTTNNKTKKKTLPRFRIIARIGARVCEWQGSPAAPAASLDRVRSLNLFYVLIQSKSVVTKMSETYFGRQSILSVANSACIYFHFLVDTHTHTHTALTPTEWRALHKFSMTPIYNNRNF